MRKRYRFIGCDGNRYYWQSVDRIPGDSRVEQISCTVAWFWYGHQMAPRGRAS